MIIRTLEDNINIWMTDLTCIPMKNKRLKQIRQITSCLILLGSRGDMVETKLCILYSSVALNNLKDVMS